MYNKNLFPFFNVIISLWVGLASPAVAVNSQSSRESVPALNANTYHSAANYPLFFVTDRNSRDKSGTIKFGNQRSADLVYGEYLRDPQTDSVKKSKRILFQSERQFLDAVSASGKTNLAVFVHGYNESFDDSMDSGLQLAKKLDAPLLVFAWPSKDKRCSYMNDECAAEWSAHHLARVLGDLGQSIGYDNITIVAHSLGVRLAEWSLKNLYLQEKPSDRFAALLFFAPDVDKETFLQDAHFLKQTCARCRVYFDRHDSHLWLSKFLHGSPRIGESDKDGSQSELSQVFQCDSSLPSHDCIPFNLVAESMHHSAVVGANN